MHNQAPCSNTRIYCTINYLLIFLLSIPLSGFSQLADQRAENVQDGQKYYLTADHTYYRDDNGDPFEGYGYWGFAHGLESFSDAYIRSRKSEYSTKMKSILAGIRSHNKYGYGTYKNDFYDDLEWLGLACMKAYHATGDSEFLDAVHEIWGYIKAGYHADDHVMPWKKNCAGLCGLSISNSPAIVLALKLYQLEGDAANLQMAKDIHAWMKANVLNEQGGIWDGPNNTNPTWQFSYNQGVYIGACLSLNIVTGEQAYADDAIFAADFVMNNRNYDPGVFYTNETGSGDGGLFKGIFSRYFADFIRLGNIPEDKKAQYKRILNFTGDYVWNNAVNKTTFNVGANWTKIQQDDLNSHLSGCHLFEAIASLNKVHVYKDVNYGGGYSQLAPGEYTLSDLNHWNISDNSITSLSVPEGYIVVVYEDDNFGGASATYTSNSKWLGSWNDKISSIKITESTGVVTLYSDADHNGNRITLGVGEYTAQDFDNLGFSNDVLSSIKVLEGFKIKLYKDNNYSGDEAVYTESQTTLGDFNDLTSSIKITPNGILGMEGTYVIKNGYSKLYLGVADDNPDNGTKIQQEGFSGNSNQQFQLIHLGDGSYTIKSVSTGKVFDIDGGAFNNGQGLKQWEEANVGQQHFIPVDAGNNRVKLIAEHSGKNIEITKNQQNEQPFQFDNTNAMSSFWWLIQVNPPSVVQVFDDVNYTGYVGHFSVGDYVLAGLNSKGVENDKLTSIKVMEGFRATLYEHDSLTGGEVSLTSSTGWIGDFNDKTTSIRIRPNGSPSLDGTFYLENRETGMVMDVEGSSTEDQAVIKQQTLNHGENQRFVITDKGDGSYEITAEHSGKSLTVAGGSIQSGDPIHLSSYDDKGHQRFILYPTNEGYFKLIAEHDGMVAQVSTNDAGEQIHQINNHGGNNAQWRLVPLLVTGMDQVSEVGFSAYPNPTSSQLRVIGGVNGELVTVYDVLGQKVYQNLLFDGTVNLQHLKNGNYLIHHNGAILRINKM